jgi:hypothetical protein
MQETQDCIDDVVLYWWTNDTLYKEIAAKVDNLEEIGRLHIYAILRITYIRRSTWQGNDSEAHHILENVAQLLHAICMVTPNFMHRFQEPLSFLTLLHGVLLQSGREGREDGFLRKAIEVFDDKVPDAIVEHLAVFAHYQLVAKPITLFEGEFVCVVVLNFTDV